MKVLIVGAGLMGSSVGLALNNSGHTVCLKDVSKTVQARAREFLKLEIEDITDPDVIVVAVPPTSVAQVILDSNRSFPDATLIDIASVMLKPQQDVETNTTEIVNWISTHPMAGKENGGFENASFDLFKNRLWVISPKANIDSRHINRVTELIADCGAIALEMDGQIHDHAVAITSHLPQVLATVLAEQLNELTPQSLAVSGQGLRDLTRIASSSGELWNEILIANKSNVIAAISQTQNALEKLKSSIENENKNEIMQQFKNGNIGKSKIPGKHGGTPQQFSQVSIEIDDKPGQLAAIFATAGSANVNIEDVRIDHALGKQVAVIDLFVDTKSLKSLTDALTNDGWKLRSIANAD
jgi:prephenate dehydrogenase